MPIWYLKFENLPGIEAGSVRRKIEYVTVSGSYARLFGSKAMISRYVLDMF